MGKKIVKKKKFNKAIMIKMEKLNSYKTLMPCVLRQHHKYIQHGSIVNRMHTRSKLRGACTNRSASERF